MMAWRLLGVSLPMLVVLTGVGCSGGEGEGGQSRLLPPAEASRQVSDLLYGRNLIADPEVNARMNEYVLQVSRDGRPADSVIPEFHQWLTAWARDHPDRVNDARVAPAPAPVKVPARPPVIPGP
jgi:hypothetical protein